MSHVATQGGAGPGSPLLSTTLGKALPRFFTGELGRCIPSPTTSQMTAMNSSLFKREGRPAISSFSGWTQKFLKLV